MKYSYILDQKCMLNTILNGNAKVNKCWQVSAKKRAGTTRIHDTCMMKATIFRSANQRSLEKRTSES